MCFSFITQFILLFIIHDELPPTPPPPCCRAASVEAAGAQEGVFLAASRPQTPEFQDNQRAGAERNHKRRFREGKHKTFGRPINISTGQQQNRFPGAQV